MKKIICFTESLSGGGAEHQIVVLAKLLYEKGYDVTVATFADVADHYNLSSQIKRVKIGQNKSYIGKWLAVWKYILHADVDCIISYRQKCNIRVLPISILRPKLKVLASERNLTISKPDMFERLLFNFFYYRADAIIPNSFSQQRHIIESNKRLASKSKVIINFIDLEHYHFQEMPPFDRVLKIGIFARYSQQKNVAGLLRMLSDMKMYRHKEFIIDWYGSQIGNIDGYNQDYLNAISYAKELGVDNMIRFLPAVKDTAAAIRNYHVVALPSLFEGFSNSIGEAICCGRPMFCSDVSDNSLMVREGQNGFLFDPTSVSSMRTSFEKLLSTDYAALKYMGQRSREIAEELFNSERFIGDYITLIEQN